MSITRETLLAPAARKCVVVQLSDREVRVLLFNAKQMLVFEQKIKEASGDHQALVNVQLAAFICDEAGNRPLDEGAADTLTEIISGADVRKIIEAGIELNGLGEKGVQEALGNSVPSP